MKTIWKNIRGYKDNYQVSNKGQIKSLPRLTTSGGLLKLQFNRFTGYYSVMLSKHGITKRIAVHILVGKAFVPNYKKGLEINHKKGNKKDNRSWMLEWVTPKQNMGHAQTNNLLNHKSKCKQVVQYSLDGKKIKEFPSVRDAARFYGYDQGNISKVCKGIRPRMYGSLWKFKTSKS